MGIFKKTAKDAAKEAGALLGDTLSANVRTATEESVRGMESFLGKAAKTANSAFDQGKGGLFEYIEAAKFNRNAATAGSTARAIVTDVSDPHAAADLLIKDNGRTVKEIQAKFIQTSKNGMDTSASSSVAHQTGAHNKGWGQYDGMDRLIRKQENYNEKGSLLDEATSLAKQRAESGSIYSEEYKDVYEHLTDETHYDNVSSGGTTIEEVKAAYDSPLQYSKAFERKAVAAEMKASAANMAKASFVTTGVLSGITNMFQVFRDEKTLSEALFDVGEDAIKSGLRGGATGVVSTAIRYSGIKAGSKLLSDSMASTVLAGGLIDGGVALYSYARGEITATELKDELIDTTAKATTTIFFTKAVTAIVGKAVTPILPMVVYTAASFIFTSTREIVKNAKLEADAFDRMTAILNESAILAKENLAQFSAMVTKCEKQQRAMLEGFIQSFDYDLSTGNNYSQALSTIVQFANQAGISLQYADFDDFKSAMNSNEPFRLG